MLLSMKSAFKDEKESFKFYKFHTVVHAPFQITEFGNLRIMDGNRFVLKIYIVLCYILCYLHSDGSKLTRFWTSMNNMTPKRTHTLSKDMMSCYMYRSQVQAAAQRVSSLTCKFLS